MSKEIVSLLVFFVGVTIFHNAVLPIFQPEIFNSYLNEGVYSLLLIIYLAGANIILRLKPPLTVVVLYVSGLVVYFDKFIS